MIQRNAQLKGYNTFGISAIASGFGTFQSVEELRTLLKERTAFNNLLILGGGSNILFTKDVDALVLRNEITGIEVVEETPDFVILKAGSGVVWHDFVMHTVDNNLGGIENLSLIPGSVGASPMQNIGAYGVEIKDVFESLEAVNIETGEMRTFTAQDCKFGYRESVFKQELKNQFVITHVSYRLSKNPVLQTSYGAIKDELAAQGNEPSIKNISDAVISIRNSKLPNPKDLGNAGSFFKNPVVTTDFANNLATQYPDMPKYPQADGSMKLAAGWLVEQAGWKGKRVGDCGVHVKQALVLVNYGAATGNEIYHLSSAVLQAVKDKFGVELEREVNIW